MKIRDWFLSDVGKMLAYAADLHVDPPWLLRQLTAEWAATCASPIETVILHSILRRGDRAALTARIMRAATEGFDAEGEQEGCMSGGSGLAGGYGIAQQQQVCADTSTLLTGATGNQYEVQQHL